MAHSVHRVAVGGALAGTLWNFHLAGKIMCSLLAGLLYLRFFVIYHDQQHEAILPHSRLAEGLMRVFGILILSPSSVWRSSHNHHHNHNSKLRGSHIGSYPIMTKAQYLKAPKALRFKYLFMRHPLTILFGYFFVFLYGMCLYPSITKLRENYDGLVAFLVHVLLAVVITWFFGWLALLLTLVIPHFIASAIGSYLFYAQHNFPGVSFSDNAGWSLRQSRDGILQFHENRTHHGLVHGQYRLSPPSSPELPHPLLPLAGGRGRHSRVADSQDHFAPPAGNHALPPFEGLGQPKLNAWWVSATSATAQRRIPLHTQALLRAPDEFLTKPQLTPPTLLCPSLLLKSPRQLQGEIVGDSSVQLTGLAPADRARAGELTFAENASYFAAAEQSQAAAILVAGPFASSNKVIIRVPNARVALARVLPVFFPPDEHPRGIHPSAVIAGSAQIDPTAHIGPQLRPGRPGAVGRPLRPHGRQ